MTRRYADAGVDLAGAEAAKQRIARAVASTRTAASRGQPGGFGGMVAVPEGITRPVLVLSMDGVGTKVLVARAAGRYDSVGEDLVNHSVNDILVHGARPLAFLDYVAGSGIGIEEVAGLVEGVARGCLRHQMALAGGETAQMPGLYQPGEYDLAGAIVGVVAESEALHGDRIVPGDLLLAYASSGLHTNGYTLARKVVAESGLGLGDPLPGGAGTLGEALLAVHTSYFAAIHPVLAAVHGLAHITGGGIPGNLVRVLPESCAAVLEAGSWAWPPLFRFLAEAGGVSQEEMREVFNLGVGMLAAVPESGLAVVQDSARRAGVAVWLAGRVERGPRGVRFV